MNIHGAPTVCRPSTGHWGTETEEMQSSSSSHYVLSTYYVQAVAADTTPTSSSEALGGGNVINLSSQMRKLRLPRAWVQEAPFGVSPRFPALTNFPLHLHSGEQTWQPCLFCVTHWPRLMDRAGPESSELRGEPPTTL